MLGNFRLATIGSAGHFNYQETLGVPNLVTQLNVLIFLCLFALFIMLASPSEKAFAYPKCNGKMRKTVIFEIRES